MNAHDLPMNEPLTDFTSPDVKNNLNQALNVVNSECKDIPIVIGGTEYRTDQVCYQVSVCSVNI